MTTDESNQEVPVQFDITKEREQLDCLIAEWRPEQDRVKIRRKVRENKRNVEEERQKGTILEDETIIPDRTINTNIKRGRVPYLNYITQSRRLLLLTDVDAPKTYTEPLEEWFTQGMRYPRWKMPWIRVIDGMHTHGGCAVEVMFDPTKPFNCTLEYIPRESLIFHQDTKQLQACPRLLRVYEITTLQLSEFKDTYNFDPTVVDRILDRYKDNKKLICVYRVLFKRDGIVFNAWYSQDETNKWLRAPQPHDIGLFAFDRSMIGQMFADPMMWEQMRLQLAQPLPLSNYPIFWFPYDVTENEILLQIPGRTALDIHVQEALTHLLTNTVNASTRASNFYPTAKDLPGEDPKMRELGRLKPGVVQSREITFNQFPWPNNIILAVTQVLDQRKSQETGNVDFAALARKDANKTATEMNLATQQSAELSITDLDVFSSPFMDVYTLCFEIARQQAIFGLCKPPPDEYRYLLLRDYNVAPAGDIEVTKRLEDRTNAKEFFNIVRGTPLAEKMFTFLLQRFFPDEAADWIAAMEGPDKDQIIAQLVQILQTVPTDELTPEQRTAFQTVLIAAQNVAGGGNDAAVSAGNTQSPTVAPAVGNAA